jgi:hypothetical protein
MRDELKPRRALLRLVPAEAGTQFFDPARDSWTAAFAEVSGVWMRDVA